jgi:5-methylcytosine-specific restriction endonuclease McrA
MQSRVADVFAHEIVSYKKARIPKALREQVWLRNMGPVFEAKCKVVWCANKINVFDYQCGHNVPESKGGKTNLGNLIPICSRCNISMGSQYTIDEWNKKFALPPPPQPTWRRFFKCQW